jgi:RNA polymerase sigma-70 factor, ECF subfamily
MRRRAWQRREVVLRPEEWALLPEAGPGSPDDAETGELLRALAAAINHHLTAHQREVLIALAADGVSIDVLADRLDSTRNALFKTLHDARLDRGGAVGGGGAAAMKARIEPAASAARASR